MRSGIALERLDFMNREQKILMEKETERIRSDFLRSISHDFRTPLTGIIGACSTLEQQDVSLDESASRSLIRSVSEEAGWLLRMVENLLTVTRVGPSGHKLNKSLEPVEEVLFEALEMARSRFPSTEIRVSQPNDLLLVPMDPTLMVQVLNNLIENAVKYAESGSPIDLTVEEQQHTVTFTVRDYGRGLSETDLQNLFEPINHRTGDSRHGMGLGLSICKSIIRAHGGTIEGRNGEGRGAVFTITLPKEETHE
jgi:two-component system sensor histidine kinase KdpD